MLEKGKSKTLIEAYKIASEGHDLAHFKEMLAEHMAAMQEDAEAKAERDAKKASKAKRKSGADTTVAVDEEADEMDVDEADGESKPKSKKRKKSLESDGAEEKVSSPNLARRNPRPCCPMSCNTDSCDYSLRKLRRLVQRSRSQCPRLLRQNHRARRRRAFRNRSHLPRKPRRNQPVATTR